MVLVLKTPSLRAEILPRLTTTAAISINDNNCISLKSSKPSCLSFRQKGISVKLPYASSLRFTTRPSSRFLKFIPFATQEETETTETEQPEQAVQEPEIEESPVGAVGVEDGAGEVEDGASGEVVADGKETPSVMMVSLQSYKEALAGNDEPKIAEIEASLKSIEGEKLELESKVATLEEELSIAKDRILRVSADFDNFRKRTERERLSLVTNAQGEVVENLLTVLDNFERAKAQIKVGTEGEEKINNSYQSIHKQFIEILDSLGVIPVKTVGNPFDPLLHEAIMREESTEFEEGIILQEFRKGFKIGDRLLRPSMVKVSAGPGPTKPGEVGSSDKAQTASKTSEDSTTDEEEGSTEPDSA